MKRDKRNKNKEEDDRDGVMAFSVLSPGFESRQPMASGLVIKLSSAYRVRAIDRLSDRDL